MQKQKEIYALMETYENHEDDTFEADVIGVFDDIEKARSAMNKRDDNNAKDIDYSYWSVFKDDMSIEHEKDYYGDYEFLSLHIKSMTLNDNNYGI